MNLEGKVAVVTGGGAGIGRAICLRLAAEGARVAVLDIRQETADETLELAGGDGVRPRLRRQRQLGRRRDVRPHRIRARAAGHPRQQRRRDRHGAPAARQAADREAARGSADGGVTTPLDALVRLTDEEWRRMLAIHLDGTFYCTRAAARSMAPRGSGAIMNMSSICGLEGCTGHPHYSAAKAAVLGFTKSAGKELIVQGIRVNAWLPGTSARPRSRARSPRSEPRSPHRRRPGRLADPEEIAATVAFLASDDASYFVGAVLSPSKELAEFDDRGRRPRGGEERPLGVRAGRSPRTP